MELEQLREIVARYLTGKNIRAVTAWPEGQRPRLEGPVTVVSLRECKTGPGSLLDYLGETYNEETGLWEERFGRRMELTFGLDTYAPEGGQELLEAAVANLATILAERGPEGLAVSRFVFGEMEYDREARLLKQKVFAVCSGWLCAVKRAEGTFLDFELRGAWKQ